MNLLADENIDAAVVYRLREAGHMVVYVAEVSPSITDDDVLLRASSQQSVLITADKDFGEMIFRQGQTHAGVVFLRLAGLTPVAKAEVLVRALRTHEAELSGAFTVVSPGSVRIRHELPNE
jgi:predicted nuclease of predicted toxin-antitoxin system